MPLVISYDIVNHRTSISNDSPYEISFIYQPDNAYHGVNTLNPGHTQIVTGQVTRDNIRVSTTDIIFVGDYNLPRVPRPTPAVYAPLPTPAIPNEYVYVDYTTTTLHMQNQQMHTNRIYMREENQEVLVNFDEEINLTPMSDFAKFCKSVEHLEVR